MEFKKISDTLIEIDGKVRVESGPVRRQAVATPELLGSATAGHYHPPIVTKDKTGKDVTTYAKDALGKKIVLGQKMDYIDWKSKERQFNVYQIDENGKWQDKGDYPTEDAAITAALTLANIPFVKSATVPPAATV